MLIIIYFIKIIKKNVLFFSAANKLKYNSVVYVSVHGQTSPYIDIADISVDKNVVLGVGGSAVHKGMYRGQVVAVKVIMDKHVGLTCLSSQMRVVK